MKAKIQEKDKASNNGMKMNKCEIRNVVRKQNKKGQIVPVVNEDGEDKKGGAYDVLSLSRGQFILM